MPTSSDDVLYSNDHFVMFIEPEISYLDIKFLFPTDTRILNKVTDVFSVCVKIHIGDMTILVNKTIGYELPKCVESFNNLTWDIKERIEKVILGNLRVMFDARGEDFTLDLDYVDDHRVESYTSNMDLDTILYNNDIELTANLAMTKEGGVGYNDQLPWWLPDELKNFRALTTGKLLVVGYKTFSTMGPLRNRVLLVMTSTGDLPVNDWGSSKGIVIPVNNYRSLLGIMATTKVKGTKEISVIGGPKTIDLFKGKYDILNLTIVEPSKVEVEPNVFIETTPRYFLEASYTGGETRDSGDGWNAVSYRRT